MKIYFLFNLQNELKIIISKKYLYNNIYILFKNFQEKNIWL